MTTALVTGANRGLGRQFALQLLERGATVYAGSRDLAALELPGAIPVQLDVTDPASVAAAAAVAADIDLLVNNAGSSTQANLLSGDWDDIRLETETHYFGTLAVVRAFAPVLAANGGGAILNVLSVLSWLAMPGAGAYCAAKSAEWSMTNAVRAELAAQHTTVSALHVGYMDTDMTRGITAPKSDPADIARQALDGVLAGEPEILADEVSKQVQAGLGGGVRTLYPDVA